MFRRRSTGGVIRNALNSKQQGLSSHELGELSALSYDAAGLRELQAQLHASLSKIGPKGSVRVSSTQFERRKSDLEPLILGLDMGDAETTALMRSKSDLSTRPRHAEKASSRARKAKTMDFVPTNKKHAIFDMLAGHFRADLEITILKSLTIIIHLCQTGSPQFFAWLVSSYRSLVSPIRHLVFSEPLSCAIQQKASLVIEYCEDSKVLAQARTFNKSLKSQLQPGIVA